MVPDQEAKLLCRFRVQPAGQEELAEHSMRVVAVLVHSQGLVKRLLRVCAAAAAEIEISELRPRSRHPGVVVAKTLLLSLYGIRPTF
jgi:hypothetical protein